MKKKILLSLLSLTVMICCFLFWPMEVNAEEDIPNGLMYEIRDDEVNIYGYSGSASSLVIPETIEGYEVTSISDWSFQYNSVLTSVTIPYSVTYIGEYAFFGCSKLTDVAFGYESPDLGELLSLRSESKRPETKAGSSGSVGAYAFGNCTKLARVSFPLNCKSIGEGAFSYCHSLTSMSLPSGLTYLGDFAFKGCSKLTTVSIPYSVKNIGLEAFSDCKSMTSFSVASSNPYFTNDESGVLFDKSYNSLIAAPAMLSGHYKIPDRTRIICSQSFYGCTKLTSIEITDVTEIQDQAFRDCTSLTKIVFPSNAPSFGINAFKSVTANAYYPAGNATWTSSVMQDWGGKITWLLDREYTYTPYKGTATINGYFGTDTYVVIPETIDGYTVTAIGEGAFLNCDAVIHITVPQTVTSIGARAFGYCEELTGVTLPDNVSTMGDGVFTQCPKLTSITVPNGVTRIKEAMFYKCTSLTSVTLPDTLTSIDLNAFWLCENLTHINLPDSLNRIEASAFEGCISLTDITIPRNLTGIGAYTFADCDGLTTITLPSNLYGLGMGAFYGCDGLTEATILGQIGTIPSELFSGCSNLNKVTISYSFTKIGDQAFRGCKKLDSITIPTGVTSIGDYAFKDCQSLSSIIIPSGVTSIGDYAFDGSYVRNITFEGDAPTIGYNAFQYTPNITAYYPADNATWTEAVREDYGGSVTWVAVVEVPQGLLYKIADGQVTITDYTGSASELVIPSVIEGYPVTSIKSYAFWYCTKLTSITIPDSVTSIGYCAFGDCSNLTDVTLGSGLVSIGSSAFSSCSSLKNIVIPDSVTTIESSAFSRTGLTSLTIPKGVTSIAGDIIYECKDLTGIYVDPANTAYSSDENGVLFNKDKTVLIRAHSSLVGSYTIPATVTSIGDSAFSNCAGLTDIDLPDNLTGISYGAFYQCDGLTSICLPDGLTEIGGYAFENCDNLTGITIPGSVIRIGEGAFTSCEALTEIDIPDGVVSIEKYAFQYCSGLINVTIGDSVTSIGEYAFQYCTNLTSATLPDNIKDIPKCLFLECTNLTDITIPESVTNIEYSVFFNCQKLTDVFYTGTQEQWDVITINTYGNDALLNAKLTVNYTAAHECTEHGEWIVTTKPTFTSTGERYLICSLCGETVTETMEVLVGRVAEWNISLKNDFTVNFYLQISEYMKTTSKIRVILGDDMVTCQPSQLEMKNGYYVVGVNVSAAQMGDSIMIIVANGSDIASTATYTVREYCNTILADDKYSEYHSLVKEMLNYGAMAQQYFGYDTENLANSGITGVANENVPETAEDIAVADNVEALDFYGASLVYRDRIAVRFYFTGDVAGMIFTANGKAYTPVANNGMYYIEVADILPQNLEQQISLTATDSQGNSLTVSYGPMNYMVRMNQKSDEKTQNLMKALYNYYLAAKALSA